MYTLLILKDDDELFPPSNNGAIKKFIQAINYFNLNYIILSSKQIKAKHIKQCDAIFIRETTNLGRIFEISQYAYNLQKPIIDSPLAIYCAGSKLIMHELIKKLNINIPHTIKSTEYIDINNITYPVVIKLDRSCFSNGIYKAHNADELRKIIDSLSSKFLIQEFIPTEFDWRIGILNNKPLFACKYFMALNSWKIIDYTQPLIDGIGIGKHECVDLKDVPNDAIKIAIEVSKQLDDGLYGVDIKEKNGIFYFIEINDNVSIDHGVEDGILGDLIYNKIIEWFVCKLYDKQH